MAEHQKQPVPHPGLEGFDPSLGGGALRVVVIPVLDERDGRRGKTLCVITLADGRVSVILCASAFSASVMAKIGLHAARRFQGRPQYGGRPWKRNFVRPRL